MKMHGVYMQEIQVCLTSILVGGEWSASRSGQFSPRGSAPGNHWVGAEWTQSRSEPYGELKVVGGVGSSEE
jgi:hypothetical protein